MLYKKKEKVRKEKKVPVMKVGTHRKSVIVLWIVLIGSVSFGVYKNFTAIDVHTVHEREIIEQRLVDTNHVENFVIDFARIYYSWENNKDSLEQRTLALGNYLTKELQILNEDSVRSDIPTSSAVMGVQICKVSKEKDNEYQVAFTVEQSITEGENISHVSSAYKVAVHEDESGNLVIVGNPTICHMPEKSDYEPKRKESDGTIDANTMDEATEFLETFFKLYPSATEQELSYYVKNHALKPVEVDYIFSELVNPSFTKLDDGRIGVSVAVKYLDQITKATQISQFNLILEKGDNWKITE